MIQRAESLTIQWWLTVVTTLFRYGSWIFLFP
jgi:hypothetical protein